jgi:hypothetical protein
MANIFEKATKFAGTALALLRRDVKLPSLFVTRYGIADFRGAAGDVVNVKRPPLLRARDKGWRSANAIVVDDLTQSKIQVQLDKFPYNAVHLSPEEATLDEVEYVRDIQAPQVQSMIEFYEDVIVDTLGAADFVLEVNFTPTSPPTAYNHDPATVALRARKLLVDAKVPTTGLYWLVGSTISENIAGNDRLLSVDTAGLSEALREGVVGKIGGFIVVEVPALDPEESYFVHETAVAVANVAPVVPRGAVSGSSVAANGMAITQIFDYDSVNAKDRSIVESFVGASVVLDPEVDSDGVIILDANDDPQMDFFRAVKVVYGSSTAKSSWLLDSTGTVSGGTYTITVDGETTAAIDFDATNDEIAEALNALDGVAGATVSGTTDKTVTLVAPAVLSAEDANITGGGSIVAS